MESLIFQQIPRIIEDLGAIKKENRNTQQGYAYRGIDDVMNRLKPLFAKHRVFPVPEIVDHKREERTNSKGTLIIHTILNVKYTFYASDGSSVSAYGIGEAMDAGDKSTNKALSSAFKYVLFQLFCIPTEEQDCDSDTYGYVLPKNDGKGRPPEKAVPETEGHAPAPARDVEWAKGVICTLPQVGGRSYGALLEKANAPEIFRALKGRGPKEEREAAEILERYLAEKGEK